MLLVSPLVNLTRVAVVLEHCLQVVVTSGVHLRGLLPAVRVFIGLGLIGRVAYGLRGADTDLINVEPLEFI